MFIFTNISLILFGTTLINFLTTYSSWLRRKTKSGDFFTWAMAAVTFWTLVSTLDYAAISIPLKVFFATLETFGYNSALALFTAFVIAYAGYENWLKKIWVKLLLWTIPTINVLLPLTNDWHNLYWTNLTLSPLGNNIVVFHHGPWFAFTAITGYCAGVVMLILLSRAGFSGHPVARRQARLLLGALLVPIAGNLLYLLNTPGLEGLDLTSITFSFSGLLFLTALYGTRLLNIIPVARRTLVEQMADSVLVLNADNQIADFNKAAQNLFNLNQKHIGQPVAPNLSHWPNLIKLILDYSTQPIVSTITDESKAQVYDVNISGLTDGGYQNYGKLISLRDVTKYKQIEETLEQRLIEIEQLNENLQHSQAQLVENQRALARLEERQRIGRDMHDSVNQSLHGLLLFSETLTVLLEKNQPEQAKLIVNRIQESGRQALKEIRLLVFETQTPLIYENSSLIKAIEERLNMVERRVGIVANLIIEKGLETDWPKTWNENIYWLTIEALNNALKHSFAKKVVIKINYNQKQLKLEIKDNGIGFDVDKTKQTGGFGLRSMRERAELIKGNLTLTSSVQSGTTVSLIIEKDS